MRLSALQVLTAYLPALTLALTTTTYSPLPTSTTKTFTYNTTHFLLNGLPHQLIGGQMDPQRIPPAYWRSRLQHARAMGLNTIFSYLFWNLLEPSASSWDFTGGNNITEFFTLAQEEGLNIVLRPGPYICGEREWGGLPAWLATIPGLVVRSNEAQFLERSGKYIETLAEVLRPMQVMNGGPVIMVQVENEYGSYGKDHNYTSSLYSLLQQNFDPETVFYTNDGGVSWTLEGGSVPGVLAEIDGGPISGFSALETFLSSSSSEGQEGPLLDGEYYTYNPDRWGEVHLTTINNPSALSQITQDIEYILGNRSASLNLYMFHGGTNFGFSNGALWEGKTRTYTSSYDYGAPLDEAGRVTTLYQSIRTTISKYVPENSIPDIPDQVPLMTIPKFELKPVGYLFDPATKANEIKAKWPMTMEELGQDYGFILYTYTHTSNSTLSGPLSVGDRARDRILIYLNGKRTGVIDSQYLHPKSSNLTLVKGDRLDLLVENLGRVDYYSLESKYENSVLDPIKGILLDQ